MFVLNYKLFGSFQQLGNKNSPKCGTSQYSLLPTEHLYAKLPKKSTPNYRKLELLINLACIRSENNGRIQTQNNGHLAGEVPMLIDE